MSDYSNIIENSKYKDNYYETTCIFFDTCSLLDLYRYPLLLSKKLLKYIKKYEELIIITRQVEKEMKKNKETVRKKEFNKYKNIDKKISNFIQKSKNNLVKELGSYKKYEFDGINEFEREVFDYIDSIDDISVRYQERFDTQKNIYTDFIINELDEFIKKLLNNNIDKNIFTTQNLINTLKEGEIRYRYSIPPGFEDRKKDPIDQFGDLIFWKQIIHFVNNSEKERFIIITSDEKSDWFNRGNNKFSALNNLYKEFNELCSDKELKIILMSDFLKSFPQDDAENQKLLLDMKKNSLVKDLDEGVLWDTILSSINSGGYDELFDYLLEEISKKNGYTLSKIMNIKIENIQIIDTELNQEEAIDYILTLKSDLILSSKVRKGAYVYNSNVIVKNETRIKIIRNIQEKEEDFIKDVNEHNKDINIIDISYIYVTMNSIRLSTSSADYDARFLSYYNTCPDCGGGINLLNDAGNGFCATCTQENDH